MYNGVKGDVGMIGVYLIFFLQFIYGIFSGYLIGSGMQEENEVVPKLFIGALALSLLVLFFTHVLFVFYAYFIWLFSMLLASWFFKVFFKRY